jgi:hypothetical protein
MSVVLINAWDPRHINVILYGNRYQDHIVSRHPGIDVESIRVVIEDPDLITRDDNDDLVENYYKQGVMPDAPRFFLKVCVRFTSDVGKVVTAYEPDRPKPTERIIWKP